MLPIHYFRSSKYGSSESSWEKSQTPVPKHLQNSWESQIPGFYKLNSTIPLIGQLLFKAAHFTYTRPISTNTILKTRLNTTFTYRYATEHTYCCLTVHKFSPEVRQGEPYHRPPKLCEATENSQRMVCFWVAFLRGTGNDVEGVYRLLLTRFFAVALQMSLDPFLWSYAVTRKNTPLAE